MVAEQYAQRQVPADGVGQVALHREGVHLVDQIGDQHHQRPLFAVCVEVQKRFVVPRLDQRRKAVEDGVQQLVVVVDAPLGRNVGVDGVGETEQPDGVALL